MPRAAPSAISSQAAARGWALGDTSGYLSPTLAGNGEGGPHLSPGAMALRAQSVAAQQCRDQAPVAGVVGQCPVQGVHGLLGDGGIGIAGGDIREIGRAILSAAQRRL